MDEQPGDNGEGFGTGGSSTECEEELRIIYLNGRRGRQQAEVGLQIGSEKEAHVVVTAEALSDQEKGPNHGTYDLTKYLAIYTRKDRHIKVEGRGGGGWAVIGGGITAVNLPPQLNHHELARALGSMTMAHTIIGYLDACGGSKKRRLEQFIDTERGKPWFFKEGWECKSYQTIVAAKVRAEAAAVESTETDWDRVRECLRQTEENPEEHKEWEVVGDPFKEPREPSKSWTRVVKIYGRSKRWCKKEWKPFRKMARKCKEASHEEIRKAKREM